MLRLDAQTTLAFGLIVVVAFIYERFLRHKDLLPPGPAGLPLVGNLLDMPVSHEYKTYARWGEKYGDVVHVNVLGQHIVILNSFDAANELLDKRSVVYSSRPFIPMLHDPTLMDANWTFGFLPQGPVWRRQRRLFVQHLSAATSHTFFGAQTSAAHGLLRSLLSAPEQLAARLRHATAETILSIAYGYQVQAMNDPLIALAEYAFETVGQGLHPGRYLVNMFPWLKYLPAWLPGAGFKRFATKVRAEARSVITIPFEDAKRRITEGTAAPSFVTSALMDMSPGDLITDIQEVAATMYGAASDTTVSTVHSCILAFILEPAIQARAHAELDSILGPATSPTFRLPTLTDREHLPYISAIVKEGLRWLPATPTGIPHATSEDDVYRGWTIPKNTIVIANTWSLLHNEETYPNSSVFKPERYLGQNPAPLPSSRGSFGFGRRECPGRHLAEDSIWVQIASLLAVFTFSPAKDEDGRDIDISHLREPPPGLILHPQQFPCTITPRSKEAEMRIRETDPE